MVSHDRRPGCGARLEQLPGVDAKCDPQRHASDDSRPGSGRDPARGTERGPQRRPPSPAVSHADRCRSGRGPHNRAEFLRCGRGVGSGLGSCMGGGVNGTRRQWPAHAEQGRKNGCDGVGRSEQGLLASTETGARSRPATAFFPARDVAVGAGPAAATEIVRAGQRSHKGSYGLEQSSPAGAAGSGVGAVRIHGTGYGTRRGYGFTGQGPRGGFPRGPRQHGFGAGQTENVGRRARAALWVAWSDASRGAEENRSPRWPARGAEGHPFAVAGRASSVGRSPPGLVLTPPPSKSERSSP